MRARYELRETLPERQEWFGCACCPPNLARLLASINSYIYSANQTEVFVHLFADSTATIQLGGEQVVLVQQTDYPWDEHVQISIHTPKPALFTLSIRIPGWCTSPVVRLGDERLSLRNVEDGYLRLHSRWSDGDTISLTFPMPVVRVWANPLVADNVGKVALQRGPIVYCFEEVDNGGEPRGSLYSRERRVRGGAGPCFAAACPGGPWAADYGTGERFVHHRKASTPSRHT